MGYYWPEGRSTWYLGCLKGVAIGVHDVVSLSSVLRFVAWALWVYMGITYLLMMVLQCYRLLACGSCRAGHCSRPPMTGKAGLVELFPEGPSTQCLRV